MTNKDNTQPIIFDFINGNSSDLNNEPGQNHNLERNEGNNKCIVRCRRCSNEFNGTFKVNNIVNYIPSYLNNNSYLNRI